MAQHFLLFRQAKTLSIMGVMNMSDADAEATFRNLRWSATDGEPVCPHCGGLDAYDCRRPNGAPRFRCKQYGKDFSITSGTLFASHKLPLKAYLIAIVICCGANQSNFLWRLRHNTGAASVSAPDRTRQSRNRIDLI